MREWVADIHGERTAAELAAEPEPPPTPSAATRRMRMMRSGNWVSTAEYCRSASRSRFFALMRGAGLGFRVARSPHRSRKEA